LLQTGDATLPWQTFPVALEVSPIGTWRQAEFGTAENSGVSADNADPDGDRLKNIFEYAFNTDPNVANGSPISYALIGGHLTITFQRPHPAPADLTYFYEVTEDLGAGPWQSGSPFTSETILDNLDGTETVTVTDLIPGLATHFLRVRIGR
jgi:hypothetical protein